jgi:hypothetical protein
MTRNSYHIYLQLSRAGKKGREKKRERRQRRENCVQAGNSDDIPGKLYKKGEDAKL